MSKIQLNLENYHYLQQLYNHNQQLFAATLKQTMEHMDRAIGAGRFDHAKNVYGRTYLNMLNEVMDAFFDTAGIADKHHHNGEKEGLKALKEDLHPLAIFTNEAVAYDVKGRVVTPGEWIQQGDFDLKDWLYGLFYGARFVSWHELATYLSLGKYDLIDVLKVQNFKSLAKLQPALAFQKDNGVPQGKLIPGTGILDGGDETTRLLDSCPACGGEWNIEHRAYAYCEECSLGGLK